MESAHLDVVVMLALEVDDPLALFGLFTLCRGDGFARALAGGVSVGDAEGFDGFVEPTVNGVEVFLDRGVVDRTLLGVRVRNVVRGHGLLHRLPSRSINASAASGDLFNGTVTARVIGNNGTITFTSTTLGALGNGSGDTISYAQIAAAVAVNTSATALAHPALLDGATSTVTLTPAVGKVMNRDAKWTYTYLNSAVVAPGTYGGVNANNSRVTYTATMP